MITWKFDVKEKGKIVSGELGTNISGTFQRHL